LGRDAVMPEEKGQKNHRYLGSDMKKKRQRGGNPANGNEDKSAQARFSKM